MDSTQKSRPSGKLEGRVWSVARKENNTETVNFLNYVELMRNNGHEPDKRITRHGTRSKGTEADILV